MKKTKKIVCTAIIVCCLLTGCGSNKSYKDAGKLADTSYNNGSDESLEDIDDLTMEHEQDYEATTDLGATEEEGPKEELSKESTSIHNSKSESNAIELNRKIIKTVTVALETQKFEQDLNQIEKKVNSLGGYIETQNMENLIDNTSRVCNMTVRVPIKKLDQFINTVNSTGNLISKNISTEDITLNYVDTQSRIKTLKAEQERILTLIEKAKTLKDVITLEERLSDICYELESYESQIRTYDNLVTYSTVNITINEVTKYTEPPVKKVSVLKKMKDGIHGTLVEIKNFLVGVCIGFVTNLPYYIIIAVVVGVVIVSVNKKRKKSKAIAEKKEDN